jgi:hypothetical protein
MRITVLVVDDHPDDGVGGALVVASAAGAATRVHVAIPCVS